MEKYKTFEELKEELGDKYDEYMYEINLSLLKKIEKVRDFVEKENTARFNNPTIQFALELRKDEMLKMLGDEN